MPLISSFDPWRSGMCTCPPKLTLNPYSGCDHDCVYCYASSYVQNFSQCRPKKDLLTALKREAAKLKGEVVSISNSSDPYPRAEANAGLTRRCLEILSGNNCRIQIITKSNLVTRDDDLLAEVPSAVALTITTDDDHLASILEPHAPSATERIRAAQDLVRKGIPVSVRIDPIIPLVNEDPDKLIATLADIGVRHITSSTYKPKPDNWRRLSQALPAVAEKLKPLYFQQGERIGGNTLLSRDLRLKLLSNVRDLASAKGIKFGVCREGLPKLNTAACDGSWLIPPATR
ncbi:MAG: radical SAM protein [Candidatus Bathyarchaeota archaeon]|nr:radical SAM protein [Candidatus Bathyarchaeota archaeon]